MALIINFDVPPTSDVFNQSSDCSLFNFYDKTGTLAPGGYGVGGNPTVASILDARAIILPYLSTATPFTVDIFSTLIPFPNTSNFPATILGTSLGYSAGQSIPSQIVSIQYQLQYQDSSRHTSAAKWVYLDCVHQCCSDKLWSKWAEPCNCSEGNKRAQEELSIKVSGTITAIHKALKTDCNKLAEAQNLVEWLNGVCQRTGCNC